MNTASIDPSPASAGASDGFVRTLAPEQMRLPPEIARQLEGPPPTLKNIALATSAGSTLRLPFRGKTYLVPPIPWDKGVELQAIAAELQEAKDAEPGQMLERTVDLLQRCVDIFHGLIRPASLVDRLLWWRRRYPFAEAELGEVMELLSFFYTAALMRLPAGNR